jgi:aerobic-type carbon monoxide dehydrogenase small subunit (CoxS/CutS family)/CO/xanthine dehydrogenase FAD-binding subunit/carbon monoxide dehydrogenase subunit G
MKPAPFAYVRPGDLDGVLAELAGGDAKVLAGGQSLVPVLAMRLGRPATLVDITAVDGLDRMDIEDGALRVGAAVRQRSVEHADLARAVPLLGLALPFVGHRELRSRGTVCGSLAHADPAAELPAVAACLDAVLEIAGPRGRRTVAAEEFFAGAMTTAVAADEVLVGAAFPVAQAGEGHGFAEIARRHGDFALAGAVTRVRRGEDGTVLEARFTAFGVSDRPVTRDVTELVGATDGAERPLREAMTELVAEVVDTAGDTHGSTGYRRRLLTVLAARELSRAHRAAQSPISPSPESQHPGPQHGGGARRRAGERGPHRAHGRVGAADLVDVTMRVNGSDVTVRVPPRMHLADALREHLGLTGTHLGCEHGVCGMCTVLVDGAATRACLLFAVQCESADIITVEGLGSPGEQHPLQRAFSAHHALQCGFCTPGMLMSSYDLLAGDGSVTPEELPERMSGVLCRCTGYRGILAAVADVAAAYPGGVPAPMNCVSRTLIGRGGGPGQGSTGPQGSGREAPVEAAEPAGEVAVPAGSPSATVEVTSALAAPVDAVWAVLEDVERMVACLPGAELSESLGGDRYRGTAGVALGPVKLSFAGLAQIVERDPADHRLRMIGQGSDAGGSATQADIRLRAEAGSGGGTVLRVHADLYLSGRVAQFGRALAGDVSRRLFEQFATAVDAAAAGREAPSRRRPSPLRLAIGALFDAVRRRSSRLWRR